MRLQRALLLATLVVATTAVRGAAPSEQRPPAPIESTLSAVGARPGAVLGQPLLVAVQIRAVTETWNPFVTRFGPGDWLGLSAWGDEAFLWEREAFERPSTRLFARRDTPAARTLALAEPYERFELEVVTRDVFLDEPWFEVRSARRLHGRVSEGTILHASRALHAIENENWNLALDQLERATAAPLPVHAREVLDGLMQRCRDEHER